MNRLLVSFVVFFSCNFLFGQVDREFWFAVPKITDGHANTGLTANNNVSFKITALTLDAEVTISMPTNPSFISRTVTVPAGQTHIEILATTWAQFAAIYNNNGPIGSVPVTGKTTNGGFLIQSDNDITVYYDFDHYYNRDLFSLKGRNGLGTEFFTPFQNIWFNDSTAYIPDPYSTIEIVATEDNTMVTITPQPGQSFDGRDDDSPWSFTLNRGEGYSIRAKYMSARGHMSGVKVTSNKKIAVTINDDTVRQAGPTCRDINGDQLVPTNKIGSKYLVMTGNKSNKNIAGALVYPYKYPNNVGEQIFVTATLPGTVINFVGMDGTLLYQTPILAAGNTDYFSVDITNANMSSIFIESTDPTKKFYTYHITGIGCELGGALLPPITDCTGSSEVNFYRSSTVNDITLNLMIPYDKDLAFTDPSQSHNHFQLIRYGTVTETIAIPGTWFEPNPAASWAVLKMAQRDFNALTISGKNHKIINTEEFFHLGMSNGTAGQTNKYGYFSSYNAARTQVYIPQNQDSSIIACYGDNITLVAGGGLQYTWHYGSPDGPPTYLSDPKAGDPKVIHPPVGIHNFFVEVQQAKCFGIDTLQLSVTINAQPKAQFEIDKTVVCPPALITLENKSINADTLIWQKQIGADTILSFQPQNDTLFTELLDNNSQDSVLVTYTLTADSKYGCGTSDTSVTIYVHPKLIANFYPKDTAGFAPFTIPFKNITQNGHLSNYIWSFGNDTLADSFEPEQTFYNDSLVERTYAVSLLATNGICSDTAIGTVTVIPKNTTKFYSQTVISEPLLYPNPASDFVKIQYYLEKPGIVKFEIISPAGQILSTSTDIKIQTGEHSNTLNIKLIPDNLFFVKIYKDGHVFTLKGTKK